MTLTQYLLQLPKPLFGEEQESVNQTASGGELPELSEKTLRQVEVRIQLSYVPFSATGNLCYIQSQEVQPDFRTSFQTMHLLDVIYACSPNMASFAPSLDFLPFPKDTNMFWKLSDYGKKLRLLHTLNFHTLPAVFRFVDNSATETEIADASSDYPFFQADNKKETGTIWISAQHYFTNVPSAIWDFRIHNRYPARETLKLFQDTPIGYDQAREYQKRLYALAESLKLAKAIQVLGQGKPLS